MFKLRKEPVLTGARCEKLEQIRVAIEVLTGERMSLLCFDFNTNKGRIQVGGKEIDEEFWFCHSDLLSFKFEGEFMIASFQQGLVRVACENRGRHVKDTVAGPFDMRWAGTSFADRREEPVYLEEALYCAQVRGLTLDQLLSNGE